MNALRIDLALGAFAVLWPGIALLYMRKRPEKLTGISYRQFRSLWLAIMLLGGTILLAAPFVRK
jgi:hypothetical protein